MTRKEQDPSIALSDERYTRAFCPACRYDLRGCPPIYRCPECGFVYVKGLSTNRFRHSTYAWAFLPCVVAAVVLLPLIVMVGSGYALLKGPQVFGQIGEDSPGLVSILAASSLALALLFIALFVRNIVGDFRSTIHWNRKAIRWRVSWWRPEQVILWRMIEDIEIRDEGTATEIVLHIRYLGEIVVPSKFYNYEGSADAFHRSVVRGWHLADK